MYVCGPTVYNYIHIGNARSFVAFDTIRKYLEYRGYVVTFVSNFTDVDDKIIQAAKTANVSIETLVETYIKAFFADTQIHACLNLCQKSLLLLKFWLQRTLPTFQMVMYFSALKSLRTMGAWLIKIWMN